MNASPIAAAMAFVNRKILITKLLIFLGLKKTRSWLENESVILATLTPW